MKEKLIITYERTFQGAWRLTTIYNGEYYTQQYFDYTKQEATKLFKELVLNK